MQPATGLRTGGRTGYRVTSLLFLVHDRLCSGSPGQKIIPRFILRRIMKDINQRIDELYDELVNLRRDFHMYPELGFEEERTAGIVEQYLRDLGLSPTRLTKTGVVALIEGAQPGPVLMLRADMDALPMEEENEVPYKSRIPGVMHACGHDAHTAMLL